MDNDDDNETNTEKADIKIEEVRNQTDKKANKKQIKDVKKDKKPSEGKQLSKSTVDEYEDDSSDEEVCTA